MTNFQALILGIIQGITEFLPVSSSGHLELLRAEMHLQPGIHYIGFDLVCHLGTLCSILFVFHRDIYEIIQSRRYLLMQISIALLPLFPLLLVMKQVKNFFGKPEFLSIFFLITACLLYIGSKVSQKQSASINRNSHRISVRNTPHSWKDAFIIGVFQAAAIFPGISRSGSTISGALIRGYTKEEAIRFSFMLAIPTIIGGLIIESKVLFNDIASTSNMSFSMYLAGFISSFIVGCLSLLILIRLIQKNAFSYFIWYCLALGIYCFFKFTWI